MSALGRQPVIELRTAGEVEIFEELARHDIAERPQLQLVDVLQPGSASRLDREDIDRAVAQVEGNCVIQGLHAEPRGLIHHRSQLAQAPAQLSTRIAWQVAKKVAESATAHRAWRNRQKA